MTLWHIEYRYHNRLAVANENSVIERHLWYGDVKEALSVYNMFIDVPLDNNWVTDSITIEPIYFDKPNNKQKR